MPQDVQSIEDLIQSSGSNSSDDDESAQDKLKRKEDEIRIKEKEREAERKAAVLGINYINLLDFSISPEALSLIEESEAKRLSAVCFFYNGADVRIATTNPENNEIGELLEKMKKKFNSRGKIYLISEHSLKHAFFLYGSVPKPRKFIKGINIDEKDLNKYSEKFSSFKDVQEQINAAPHVSEIVTIIMAASIKTRSSDVHIEGEEEDIKIRFRIDGVLHDVAMIDKELWKNIISRIKILTGVKINVTNKPQDGRMSIYMQSDKIDIRASFLPTAYGESVVMRLLLSSSLVISFEELGLRGSSFKQLEREVLRPNGMIITTGPTGSGKTTTLYAILRKLNSPETKIITIEDPIEYQLKGVNQSQATEKYTFAKGLRSIVRQDPDIIMVGEIRDLETAEIAIQAALTGHLVLSTIHTNDAAGTVPRFLSMGTKPFLLAPALNAMIGQRLVRRICDKCKEEAKLNKESLERVEKIVKNMPKEDLGGHDFKNLKFYKGSGCEDCQGIGYKGRIGIYEIMTMNKDIEKMILAGNVSEFDMRDIAVKNGMITMVGDGILKALDGITSVEEVFRVAEESN